jgi:hypothetical protein
MPLTAFQHEVFATLRQSRSPNSFVFGATVLNAAAKTPRYSRDIDLCHDLETAVAESAAADEAALVAAGYTVSRGSFASLCFSAPRSPVTMAA